MPEEYAIVRKAGINAPNIAYFLSRLVLFNGNTVLQVLIWRMNMTRVGTFCSCLGTFLTSKLYHVFLRSTEWHMSCHSRSARQLWNSQIYCKWICCDCYAGHVTPIFLSPQSCLQALKDYYHHLRDILVSYRWSVCFSHVEHNDSWVNYFSLLLYLDDS